MINDSSSFFIIREIIGRSVERRRLFHLTSHSAAPAVATSPLR